MELFEYKNYIKGKTVSLLGFGISNKAMADFLYENGAKIIIRDKKDPESLAKQAEKYNPIKIFGGDNYLDEIKEDILFKTPSFYPYEAHLIAAEKNGVQITNDIKAFFDTSRAKSFCVTGSDGKTTTTTLISKILEKSCEKSEKKVYLGGNIGTPLIKYINEISENDFVAAELSSFQLMSANIAPYCAVITNITPNHLNWHKDMQEYTDAKENILKNAKRRVLNAKNPITASFAEKYNNVVLFSSEKIIYPDKNVIATVYEKDGVICYNDGKETPVLPVKNIKLPGRHNVENYMTAIAAVYEFATVDAICDIAENFGGVEHRIEFVREKDGVKFYNSSIDTSPTRTLAALNAFSQRLIVIMCGRDKNLPLWDLCEPVKQKTKAIVLTGDVKDKLYELFVNSGYGKNNLYCENDFDTAVKRAAEIAKCGDIVLLSPSATSFDCFNNFEERGKRFKEIINNL